MNKVFIGTQDRPLTADFEVNKVKSYTTKEGKQGFWHQGTLATAEFSIGYVSIFSATEKQEKTMIAVKGVLVISGALNHKSQDGFYINKQFNLV